MSKPCQTILEEGPLEGLHHSQSDRAAEHHMDTKEYLSTGGTPAEFHPAVTFHRPVPGGGFLVASEGLDGYHKRDGSAGYHTADEDDDDDGLTTTTIRATSVPASDPE